MKPQRTLHREREEEPMLRVIYPVVLLLLLAVRLVAVAAQGTFTTIDVPGSIDTRVIGINPQGDMVGQYTDAVRVNHGFLLSDGEFTTIDFPDATATGATEITPGGDIVGGYLSDDGVGHGFLLSKRP
jgi:hypothetical protein